MFGASFRIRSQRGDAVVGANGGQFAVTFCVALGTDPGFVGAAIDYTRVNSARSSMQVP